MPPGVDTTSRTRYFDTVAMEKFPLPAEPSEKYTAFENALGRWLLVILPVVIIGHVLGALALVAAFISANFNILGWLE